MVEGRIVTAGIMLAIFVTMVGVAVTQYDGETRFMPLVIGIPGLVLSAIQFIVELRAKSGGRIGAADRRATYRMFGWFFVFIAGIILFGFPYAGPVLVVLYLRLSWHEKWYLCLAAGAFSWGVLYGVFEHFLDLPLFDGLVVEWLLG